VVPRPQLYEYPGSFSSTDEPGNFDISNIHDWIKNNLAGNASIVGTVKSPTGENALRIQYKYSGGESRRYDIFQNANTGAVFVHEATKRSGGFVASRQISEEGKPAPLYGGGKYGAVPTNLAQALADERGPVVGLMNQRAPYINFSEMTGQHAVRFANMYTLPESAKYSQDVQKYAQGLGYQYGARNTTGHIYNLEASVFANTPVLPSGVVVGLTTPKFQGTATHEHQTISRAPGAPIPRLKMPINLTDSPTAYSGQVMNFDFRLQGLQIPEGAGLIRQNEYYYGRRAEEIIPKHRFEKIREKYDLQPGDVFSLGKNKQYSIQEGDRFRGNLRREITGLGITNPGNYASLRIDEIEETQEGYRVAVTKYASDASFKQSGIKTFGVGVGPTALERGTDIMARISGKGYVATALNIYSTAIGLQGGTKAAFKDFARFAYERYGISTAEAEKLFNGGRIAPQARQMVVERALEYTNELWKPITQRDVEISEETYKRALTKRGTVRKLSDGRPLFENVRSREGGGYLVDINDYQLKAPVTMRARAEFFGGRHLFTQEEMTRMSHVNPSLYESLISRERRGEFRNDSRAIMQAARANVSLPQYENIKNRVIGIESTNFAQISQDVFSEMGDYATEGELAQETMRRIGRKNRGKFIRVGGKILAPADVIARSFALDEEGQNVSQYGLAAYNAIREEARILEAQKLGDAGETMIRERDEAVIEAMSQQRQLAERPTTVRKAMGIETEVMGGPIRGIEGLPANVAAMSVRTFKDQIRNLPRNEQFRMMRLFRQGKAIITASMDPAANPEAAFINLHAMPLANARRMFGLRHLRATRGEIVTSPELAYAGTRDQDADLIRAVVNTSRNARAHTVEQLRQFGALSRGSETVKQQETIQERVSLNKFIQESTQKGFKPMEEVIGAFHQELTAKGLMGPAYEFGIRELHPFAAGLIQEAGLSGKDARSIMGNIGLVAQEGYQKALDLGTELGEATDFLLKARTGLSVDARSGKSRSPFMVSGGKQIPINAADEFQFANLGLSKLMSIGDPNDKVLQGHLAAGMLPLHIANNRSKLKQMREFIGRFRASGDEIMSKEMRAELESITGQSATSLFYGDKDPTKRAILPSYLSGATALNAYKIGSKRDFPKYTTREGDVDTGAFIGQSGRSAKKIRAIRRARVLGGRVPNAITSGDVQETIKYIRESDPVAARYATHLQRYFPEDKVNYEDVAHGLAEQPPEDFPGNTTLRGNIQTGDRPSPESLGDAPSGAAGASSDGGGSQKPPVDDLGGFYQGPDGEPEIPQGRGGSGDIITNYTVNQPRIVATRPLSRKQLVQTREAFRMLQAVRAGKVALSPTQFVRAYENLSQGASKIRSRRREVQHQQYSGVVTGTDRTAFEFFQQHSPDITQVLSDFKKEFDQTAGMLERRQLIGEMRRPPKRLSDEKLDEASSNLQILKKHLKDLGPLLEGVNKGYEMQTKQAKSLVQAFNRFENVFRNVEQRSRFGPPDQPDKYLSGAEKEILQGGQSIDYRNIRKLRALRRSLTYQKLSSEFDEDEEILNMRKREILTARGRTASRRRAQAFASGLFDSGYEFMGANFTNPNIIRALGVAQRFGSALFNPFSVYMASQMKRVFIDPVMGAANEYQQSLMLRDQTLFAGGQISYEDFMSGRYGEISRRNVKREQFKLGIGRHAFDAYQPIIDIAASPEIAKGSLGAMGAIGMPALGIGAIVGSLSGSLALGGLAAGFTAGAATISYGLANRDNYASVGRLMQGGRLGQLFTNPEGIMGRGVGVLEQGLDTIFGGVSPEKQNVYRKREYSAFFRTALDFAQQTGDVSPLDVYHRLQLGGNRQFLGINIPGQRISPKTLEQMGFTEGQFISAFAAEQIERIGAQSGLNVEGASSIYGTLTRYTGARTVSDEEIRRAATFQRLGIDAAQYARQYRNIQLALGNNIDKAAALQGVLQFADSGLGAAQLEQTVRGLQYGEQSANIRIAGGLRGREFGTFSSLTDPASELYIRTDTALAKANIRSSFLANNPLARALETATGAENYLQSARLTALLDNSNAGLIGQLQNISYGRSAGSVVNTLGYIGLGFSETPQLLNQAEQFFGNLNLSSLGTIDASRGLQLARAYQGVVGAGGSLSAFASQTVAGSGAPVTSQAQRIAAQNIILEAEQVQLGGRGFEDFVQRYELSNAASRQRLAVNAQAYAAGRGFGFLGQFDNETNALLANAYTGGLATQVYAAQNEIYSNYGYMPRGVEAFTQGILQGIQSPETAGLSMRQLSQFHQLSRFSQIAAAFGTPIGTAYGAAIDGSRLSAQQFTLAQMASGGNAIALSQLASQGQLGNQYQTINMQTGLGIFEENVPKQMINFARQTDTFGLLSGVTNEELAGGTLGIQNRIRQIAEGHATFQYNMGQLGRNISVGMNMGGSTTFGAGGQLIGGNVNILTDMFSKLGLTFNPGNGMTQFQVQDAMRNLQRQQMLLANQQQQRSLDLSQQRFDLSGRQFYERFDLNQRQFRLSTQFTEAQMERQRQRQIRTFEYQEEDLQFSRNMSDIQFAFQMEDFDRNIRFARGRQRIDLMRQRDRATVLFSMNRGQQNRQRERLEETKQYEEEEFELKKRHFEETKALREEEFEMQKRHFEERRALEQQAMELSKERHQRNIEFIQQRIRLEDQQILLSRQGYLANQVMAQKSAEEARKAQLETTRYNNALNGLQQTMKKQQAIIQLHATTGQLFLKVMSGMNASQAAYNKAVVAARGSVNALVASIKALSSTARGTSSAINTQRAPSSGSGSGGAQISRMSGGYIGPSQHDNMVPSPRASTVIIPMRNGGYTGDGFKNESAGIFELHRGEYVVPQGGALVMRENNQQTQLLTEIRDLLRRLVEFGPGRINATIAVGDGKGLSIDEIIQQVQSEVF